jgi:hypothetical protein
MINPSEHSGDWRPSTESGHTDPKGVADERTDETPASDHARKGGGPLLAWWNAYFGEDNRA